MTFSWIGLALGVVVGALGALAAASHLARLPYRRPGETGRLPDPGPRTRTVLVGAGLLTCGSLGALAHPAAALPAYWAFALICLPLAWVDLDVHRLPERLTLPAYPLLAVLLVVAALITSDWGALWRALLAAAAGYVVFFVVAFAAPSSFGLGDVTLTGLVALITGWTSWTYVGLGLLAGWTIGGLVALVLMAARRIRGSSAIPLGPCLCAGAWLVLLMT